jgi:hypothetical protein
MTERKLELSVHIDTRYRRSKLYGQPTNFSLFQGKFIAGDNSKIQNLKSQI